MVVNRDGEQNGWGGKGKASVLNFTQILKNK